MLNPDGTPDITLAAADRSYRATLRSQALRVGCKALSVLILARLISPADHGLFAMAASVFLVLVLFRDLGLGVAAVQARALSEEQLSTLWRVHVVMGFALAAMAVALAPVAALFYREPRISMLLAAMSISLALIGLNGWPRILLTRELRFTDLNRIETLAAVLGTFWMIVAAAVGARAYTFAIFLLVSEGITVIGVWRLCHWRPRAPVRWASLRALWRPGANLTGYHLITALHQLLDTFLMGRWFGPVALGLYSRPSQLLLLPSQHLTGPLTQVLMATLSRIGDDEPAFVAHVRESANLIAHLTLPIAVICATLPDELVFVFLGPNWAAAAPLLRWLAIGGSAVFLGSTVYAVCVASSHSGRLAKISAVSLVATLAALLVGRQHGPEGLAAAMALSQIVLLVPRLWWATRGTAVGLTTYTSAFVGPLALSAALAIGIFAGRAVAPSTPRLLPLGGALLGGAIAGVLLLAVWPHVRREVFRASSRAVPPNPSPVAGALADPGAAVRSTGSRPPFR